MKAGPEARESLLSPEDKETNHKGSAQSNHVFFNNRSPSLYWSFVLFLILGVLVYIAVLVTVDYTTCRPCSYGQREINGNPSIPRHVIKYEAKPEWSGMLPPWNQEPSDELDAAWDDLLYALNIRVMKDELDLVGNVTAERVRVNRGDYASEVGVYHHLHCLNNLRMVVHWDYYESRLPKYDPKNNPFAKTHSDHCIDTIRQSIMCHASTEILSLVWTNNPDEPNAKDLGARGKTTCIDWDSLDGWARKRALVSGNFTYRPGPFYKPEPTDLPAE
ncbi:hypothetical protein F5Y14DRAFT_459518 [Nemania sp. NC0429]|nr:hypothetical protein F5Y14DRAFT_459518 [Nemania sp. NC0429]